MGSWMVDMLLVAVAVTVMGFIFFRLVFSATEDARREMAGRPRQRFERRETERADGRRVKGTPPQGQERRVAARR